MSLKTPILLIIFKRPELTRQAIKAIKAAKPTVLLVAADGPRSDAERELCEATRRVIAEVDWDCEIRTNFSEKNLGCGIRVYTAIDWALSQFEDVIILEDDCVPDPSFFSYCESLLDYYRHDNRVMHISGNNFQTRQPTTKNGYYFSKYTHAWGWATWRRAWRHFDWSLKDWPELKQAGLVKLWCDDPDEQNYWSQIFDKMHLGAPDVWDYQWNCCVWAQNGLVILPSVNLVSNLGFGADATHTKDDNAYMKLATNSAHNLQHPLSMVRNYEADYFTFENNFGGNAIKEARSRSTLRARLSRFPSRVILKLGRIFSSPFKNQRQH